MKLESLESFICVVDRQSFSRAAEELFLSQPALSRQIAELEKNVGCTLLTRSTRSVQPTDAGRIFMVRAMRLVKEWKALTKEMTLFSGKQSTIMRIGYTMSGQVAYLVRGLMRGYPRAPDSGMTIQRDFPYQLLKNIRSGLLDCAVMHRPSVGDAYGLALRRITQSGMYVMIPKSHSLARQHEVTLSEVAHETDVRCFRHIDPLYYNAVDEGFLKVGLQPMAYVETGDPAECQLMVVGMRYVQLCPSIYPVPDGFLALPITDWQINFDLMLVWRKHDEDARIRLFADAICEQGDED
ncbi:MAG: LysR family transcriptional regulator [Clostridia bacterium]